MIVYLAVLATFLVFMTFLASTQLGILLVFVAKPVIDASWAHSIGSINALKVVGLMVPMFVLLRSSNPERRLTDLPFIWIWFIYVAYNIMTYVIGTSERDILKGVELSVRILNGLVGYYMLQAYFADRESFRRLLLCLILAGLFPMLMGLYQSITGVVWQERITVGLVRNVGVYHDAFTFRSYAFQTLAAIILYWCYFLERNRHRIKKLIILGLAGLCMIVLFNIHSKAAVVIVLAWFLIWLVSYRRFLPILFAVCALAITTLVYQDRIQSDIEQLFYKEIAGLAEGADEYTQQKTLAGRWFMWERKLGEFQDRTTAGQFFGDGNPGNAHNDYLSKLLSGGVFGLIIYLVLLGIVGLRIVRQYIRERSPLNVMAVMLFTMWIIDTLGLVPSLYPAYQWYVWGFIGLAFKGINWAPDMSRASRIRAKSGVDPILRTAN